MCEEYLALGRKEGDLRAVGAGLTYLGEILRSEGDLEGAVKVYDELLPLSRRRNQPVTLAIGLGNLAMIRAAMGDLAGAKAALGESAGLVAVTGSKRILVASIDCAASLAALDGQPALAARLYGASELAHERSGAQREPADARFHEPIKARAREALGEAAFTAAYAGGRALPLEAVFAEAHAWLRGSGPVS
jgi:hypothetical protein